MEKALLSEKPVTAVRIRLQERTKREQQELLQQKQDLKIQLQQRALHREELRQRLGNEESS
jgi:hypothetical protein